MKHTHASQGRTPTMSDKGPLSAEEAMSLATDAKAEVAKIKKELKASRSPISPHKSNGLQAASGFEMCFLLCISDPSTFGAGGPNQNTPGIQYNEVNSHVAHVFCLQAAKKDAKSNRKAKEKIELEINEWAQRVATEKVRSLLGNC